MTCPARWRRTSQSLGRFKTCLWSWLFGRRLKKYPFVFQTSSKSVCIYFTFLLFLVINISKKQPTSRFQSWYLCITLLPKASAPLICLSEFCHLFFGVVFAKIISFSCAASNANVAISNRIHTSTCWETRYKIF